MTAVSLQPSKLQTWMVAKLFGSPSDNRSSSNPDQSPISAGVPGQSVSGITLSAISSLQTSGATAAAAKAKNPQDDQKPLNFTSLVLSFDTKTNQITGLTDDMLKEYTDYINGPDLPPVAPGYPPQQKTLGLVGGMLQLKAINEMTTKQISDALYGNGLPAINGKYGDFVDSPKLTFANYIEDAKDDASYRRSQVDNTELPDDIRASLLFDANRIDADVKGMQAAYADRTLKFIKATDIPGLNYSAIETSKGYSAVKGAMESGGTEHYDQSVMDKWGAEHPNSEWTGYGGVMMVWTW